MHEEEMKISYDLRDYGIFWPLNCGTCWWLTLNTGNAVNKKALMLANLLTESIWFLTSIFPCWLKISGSAFVNNSCSLWQQQWVGRDKMSECVSTEDGFVPDFCKHFVAILSQYWFVQKNCICWWDVWAWKGKDSWGCAVLVLRAASGTWAHMWQSRDGLAVVGLRQRAA